MEFIAQLIPLFVPLAVALVKKVAGQLPKDKIPLIVAICGVIGGAVSGASDATLQQYMLDMLNGGFVALSGVGLHQIYKQQKKKKQ